MNLGRNQRITKRYMTIPLTACVISGLLFSAIKMFSTVFVLPNTTKFASAHMHPDYTYPTYE